MKTLTQALALAAPTAAVAVVWPPAALLALPEKVLQFGTGVLLRGLPDFMIDQANRQGLFNGRIVVVKSTDGGDATAFARQNGLYTVCVRGVANGQPVEENVVCASISRVLSASSQWAEVLKFATSPGLQVVISNTTEVGIQFVNEDIHLMPPQSFPGKLLAVLYARFQAFGGDVRRGLVVVPTELIPDNGRRLEAIVLELAHRNNLGGEFLDWLETANDFCNTLVDRIVPGRPDAAPAARLQVELGYQDELLTMAEAYSLWAIEGGARVREVLAFHPVAGVVIQPDIALFRELKLRLLNGTHTLSFALAHLLGCATVREALEKEDLARFIRNLMLADLRPGIPYAVEEEVGQNFGRQVLDRFRNPYLEHRWLAIAVQGTAKMQLRNVPTLLHYYEQLGGTVPHHMALGFAAYLLFMRNTAAAPGTGQGEANGHPYPIRDDRAAYFADLWARLPPEELTTAVLHNTTLWGHDLTRLPGFAECVGHYLLQLLAEGAAATLAAFFARQPATVFNS